MSGEWIRSDDERLGELRGTVQKVRLAIYPEKFEPGPEFTAWLDMDDLWQSERGQYINVKREWIQVLWPTPPIIALLNERMQNAADKLADELWSGTGRFKHNPAKEFGGLHSLLKGKK